MPTPPVNWPAIVKIDGDAELIFIRSRDEWERDCEHHRFEYRNNDMLIDASGKLYSLTNRDNDCAVPEPANRTMTCEEVTSLVRAHAAQANSCCIEKIAAPSIRDIIELVASLDTDGRSG